MPYGADAIGIFCTTCLQAKVGAPCALARARNATRHSVLRDLRETCRAGAMRIVFAMLSLCLAAVADAQVRPADCRQQTLLRTLSIHRMPDVHGCSANSVAALLRAAHYPTTVAPLPLNGPAVHATVVNPDGADTSGFSRPSRVGPTLLKAPSRRSVSWRL